MKSNKLILNKCEIESCNETLNLHKHHIIERTQVNTTNHIMNLAILCATHHELVHSGHLKIIGIFPSTKLPNKRTLIYELDGKKNLDIDFPYIEFKNKSFKVYGDE
jgi:hypothetical protein